MAWFQLLWRQAFRSKRVIEPSAFLDANVTLGLFASVCLYVCLRSPERSNWAFTGLVALTSATHLGGRVLAGIWNRLLARILFVQGLSLFCATLALVVMSTELTLRASHLNDVRYLPGLTSSLLVHASLEIHFFGPPALEAWPVRRAALVLGVAAELMMAAALVWHIAR